MGEFTEDDLEEVPEADGVRVYLCSNCNRPHVVLFDDDWEPIIQFVIPDGFVEELSRMMSKGGVH